MAYNTKSLLRDVDGKIVPQGFDLTADAYKALTGQDLGGGRFGLDGVQWGKTASGLFVPIKVTNDGTQEVQLSGSRFFRNGKYLKTVSRSNPGYNVYFGDTAYAALPGLVPFDKRGLTDLGCMVFNGTDKLFSVEALHLWTRHTEDYSADHTKGYARRSIEIPAIEVPVGATIYIDLLDVIADDVVPFWGFSEGVSLYLRKTTPEGTGTVYCSWFGVEAGGVS